MRRRDRRGGSTARPATATLALHGGLPHGPHHGRGPGHAHEVGAPQGAAPRVRPARCSTGSSRPLARPAPTGSCDHAPRRRRRPGAARGHVKAQQTEGEGTGSAVLAARDDVDPDSTVIVLSGDVPLTSSRLLAELAPSTRTRTRRRRCSRPRSSTRPATAASSAAPTAASSASSRPSTRRARQLAIREINIGTYASGRATCSRRSTRGRDERRALPHRRLPADPRERRPDRRHTTTDVSSAMGVNTRADLAAVQEIAQRRVIDALAASGVTFESPAPRASTRPLRIGADTTIANGVTSRARPRSARAARSARRPRSSTRRWATARRSSTPT